MTTDPFFILSQLPIKVAVSSCLLGERVRYDGNHKAHTFIIDQLSTKLELLAVCPEVSIGMGVPRIPIRLQQLNEQIEAVMTNDQLSAVTDPLRQCAQQFLHKHQDVSGYILKSKSPSCGISNTKIFSESGNLYSTQGSGIFARELMKKARCCAFISEDLLAQESSRLEFLIKVVALQRLYQSLTYYEPERLIAVYLENYLPLLKVMDNNILIDADSLRAANKKQLGQEDWQQFRHDLCEIFTVPISRAVIAHFLLENVYRCNADKNKLRTAIDEFSQYELSWSGLKRVFEDQLQASSPFTQSEFNPCQWLIPFDI